MANTPEASARGNTSAVLGRFVEPWAAPFSDWSRFSFFDRDVLSLPVLNALALDRGLVNERGVAMRFVDANETREALPAGDAAARYEQHIWTFGEVPTRTAGDGRWHDFYNALVWLRFARLKGRLNGLQVRALAQGGVACAGMSRRGGVRDRLTLFDESGALVLTRDRTLASALRTFDWDGLFVSGRSRFVEAARVVVVGHALHEKLRAPYKSLCAHAVILNLDHDVDWEAIDGAAADAVQAACETGDAFMPLPLLGIPRWWPANEEPAFYNDSRVFRSGRRLR